MQTVPARPHGVRWGTVFGVELGDATGAMHRAAAAAIGLRQYQIRNGENEIIQVACGFNTMRKKQLERWRHDRQANWIGAAEAAKYR